MIDSQGLIGFYLHYAFLFGMSLTTLIILVVLWKKKKLNFDEEAKHFFLDKDE